MDMTTNEKAALVDQARAGNQEVREKIIHSLLRMIVVYATRWRTVEIDSGFLDLVSIGNLELVKYFGRAPPRRTEALQYIVRSSICSSPLFSSIDLSACIGTLFIIDTYSIHKASFRIYYDGSYLYIFDRFASGGLHMAYLVELWNMQWLTSIGVILAILSALYTTCSYLDNKLDKKLSSIKTITDGFIIGIVIALLFVFFSLISVVFDGVISTVLYSIYHENSLLPAPDTSTGFAIVIPGGLIIGVVLGVIYHLLKGKEQVFYKNIFLFGLVGFVLMFCCSIGLEEWSLSPAFFSSHQTLFSLLLYSVGDIGGCLFGIAIAQTRQSLWRNLIMFSLLFIMLTLLFLLFSTHGVSIYEHVLEGIFYYSQLGLLVGLSVYRWSQPRTEFERSSWRKFISWLSFGGIFLPLVFLVVFTINPGNQPFIYFILHYFLLVGIINGQGDKLIKYAKYRGRLKDGSIHPSVNRKRFLYGLIIGILYVLPVVLFTWLIDVLLRHTIGTVIYNLLQNIDFAVLVGLLIGFIYGFGPFIIDRVNSFDERRLVRIGIALTIVGALIAAIPH